MLKNGNYIITYLISEDGSLWQSFNEKIPYDGSSISTDKFVNVTWGLLDGASENMNATFYIDDINVFKVENSEVNILKPYEFESGTSFSAPYVSAAVAAISNKYKDVTDAKERENILLQAVRKVDALADKTVTGGTLDLSKLPKQEPNLLLSTIEEKPSYLSNENITVRGLEGEDKYEYNIGGEWKDLTEKTIKLDKDGVYKIQIRQKDSEGAESKTYYCVLDRVAPKLEINKENSDSVVIEVSDELSGIKDSSIQYSFSKDKTSPDDSLYQKSALSSNKATIEFPAESGNYYLNVKPVSDNSGNVSKDSSYQFGPYSVTGTSNGGSSGGSNNGSGSNGNSGGSNTGGSGNGSASLSNANGSNTSGGTDNKTLDDYYNKAGEDKTAETETVEGSGEEQSEVPATSPHTGDKITYYMISLIVSISGIGIILYIKYNNKKKLY